MAAMYIGRRVAGAYGDTATVRDGVVNGREGQVLPVASVPAAERSCALPGRVQFGFVRRFTGEATPPPHPLPSPNPPNLARLVYNSIFATKYIF